MELAGTAVIGMLVLGLVLLGAAVERTLSARTRPNAERVEEVVLQPIPVAEHPPAERVRALRSMPYAEYLSSPEWLAKRSQALARAERRCQVCNGMRALQVHHRTYQRRAIETEMDLTVLCDGCHGLFHRHRRVQG